MNLNLQKILDQQANQRGIKVAVVAIAKDEDAYIDEWIDHYLNKLKFDDVYIFDNNPKDKPLTCDPRFANKVQFFDVRGENNIQISAYNAAYKKLGQRYDWLAFFDIDEFLELMWYDDIHEFIKGINASNFDAIHCNWLMYSDNGHTNADLSKPVQERFTSPVPNNIQNSHVKCIIKTKNRNVKFDNPHYGRGCKSACDMTGAPIDIICPFNKNMWQSYIGGYIKHYWSKSTEEFVNKVKRWEDVESVVKELKPKYFNVNCRTAKKSLMLRKELGI